MRIFIGYGSNERDRWIEDLVFLLLTAFGCDLICGKSVYGGARTQFAKMVSCLAGRGSGTGREENGCTQGQSFGKVDVVRLLDAGFGFGTIHYLDIDPEFAGYIQYGFMDIWRQTAAWERRRRRFAAITLCDYASSALS